jgi:non-ribosomal peptide synthetase component E (peptide arylation enzyme)
MLTNSVSTLSGLLRDSASTWPERAAVSSAAGDRALTYRDLDALVADLASQLNRRSSTASPLTWTNSPGPGGPRT